jgi:hypothetical protein
MVNVRRAFVVWGIGILACLSPGGGFVPAAHAQQTVMVTRSVAGLPAHPPISRRSLERYGQVLGLTDEQAEFARTIHEAYAAGMEQANRTRRAAFEDARRAAEDTGDHGAMMERMPEIEKAFRTTSDALEKTFFDDLRAILSEAQEERWAGVERMRRRELGMRGATLSGEGVDLVDLVASLKLGADVAQSLAPTLAEYEAEMDRHMQARVRMMAEDTLGMADLRDDPMKAMERFQASMKASRELGVKVRDANAQYARRVGAMLPEEARGAFEEELRKRSFPMVYRPSRAARDLEAALALEDLTTDQRERVQGVLERYRREAAVANDRWANAIRETEAAGEDGAIATPMGMMRISGGNEPAALTEARKARREADERATAALRSILTPGQQERLPKGHPEEDGAVMLGGARMIMEAR